MPMASILKAPHSCFKSNIPYTIHQPGEGALDETQPSPPRSGPTHTHTLAGAKRGSVPFLLCERAFEIWCLSVWTYDLREFDERRTAGVAGVPCFQRVEN